MIVNEACWLISLWTSHAGFRRSTGSILEFIHLSDTAWKTDTWFLLLRKSCVLSFFHFNPINAIRQSQGSKVGYSHDGLKNISVKFGGTACTLQAQQWRVLSLLSLKQNNKMREFPLGCPFSTHPYQQAMLFSC